MIKLKKLPKFILEINHKTYRGAKLFWDFANDIPLLKTVAGPDSKQWDERVQEEIKVFNTWRKFNKNLPLRNLEISNNKRRFTIEINVNELFNYPKKWKKVTILVPMRYPFQMPQIGDPSSDLEFIKILRNWTNGRPFCMPRVINIWWNKLKGRAGIAHFLHVFIAFLTVAGRKTKKIKTGYALDI